MNPSKGDGYDRRSHRRRRAASTPPHHPYARPQQNIRPSNAPMPPLSQILYGRGLPRGASSNYTRGQGTSSHATGQPTLQCSTIVHVPPVLQQDLMSYTEDYLSRSHLQNPRRDNIHGDQRQASNAYRSRSCDPSPYIERANLDRRHPLPAESQQALLWHTDDLTSSRAHLQNPRVNNIHADQRQASSADWSYDASSRRYIERENLNSRDQLYAERQPALVQRIDQLASGVAQLQLQNRRPDNRYADQRQDYNALSAADWAREAREQQGLPDASIDPRRPDALLAVHDMQAHRAIHPTVGPGETIARTSAWYEQQGRRSDEIQVVADERLPWYMDVPPEYWTDPGALCVHCGGGVWGQDLDFDIRQCGHYQHRGCRDPYNGACRACAAGTRVFRFEF